MPKSLQGKVVLITGASSGFGADAARLFAKEGCRVVLSARRMDRMQAVAEEIIAAGGDAAVIQMDVTEYDQIEGVVQTIIDNYGRIDILFNNAGFGRLDWLEKLDAERDIHAQIAVNLTGLIQVTRVVLPYMIRQRSGHIINMSSVAGWIAPPSYSIYATTKFGVRAFTEALRREVRHLGIRVSGIYPGGAATEFGQHTGKSSLKRSLKLPKWIHMTSEYVARKVVSISKRPRPTVIIPWWMVPVIFLTRHFPRITDWVLVQIAKRTHKA
jgi:hypothetical protein